MCGVSAAATIPMRQLMLWGFAWRAAWQGACPSLRTALWGACSKLSTAFNKPVLEPFAPHPTTAVPPESLVQFASSARSSTLLLQQPA